MVSKGSSEHVNFIIALFTALLDISPLVTDSAEHQNCLKQLIAFKLYVNLSFIFSGCHMCCHKEGCGKYFLFFWQMV